MGIGELVLPVGDFDSKAISAGIQDKQFDGFYSFIAWHAFRTVAFFGVSIESRLRKVEQPGMGSMNHGAMAISIAFPLRRRQEKWRYRNMNALRS